MKVAPEPTSTATASATASPPPNQHTAWTDGKGKSSVEGSSEEGKGQQGTSSRKMSGAEGSNKPIASAGVGESGSGSGPSSTSPTAASRRTHVTVHPPTTNTRPFPRDRPAPVTTKPSLISRATSRGSTGGRGSLDDGDSDSPTSGERFVYGASSTRQTTLAADSASPTRATTTHSNVRTATATLIAHVRNNTLHGLANGAINDGPATPSGANASPTAATTSGHGTASSPSPSPADSVAISIRSSKVVPRIVGVARADSSLDGSAREGEDHPKQSQSRSRMGLITRVREYQRGKRDMESSKRGTGSGTGAGPGTPLSPRNIDSARRSKSEQELENQRRWSLHPDDAVHRWMLLFYISAIFGNAWSVPFRLTIGYKRIDGVFAAWNGVDIIFDLTYLTAMAFKTRLAFYEDGALVFDRSRIWHRYWKSGDLFVDIFSILPFDWLLMAVDQPVESVFFRLVRLIQFFFVARYINELENSPGVNVLAIRIGKSTLLYLMTSHFIGCGFFAFGLPNDFGTNSWLPPEEWLERPYLSQYLQVLYWGLGALSDRLEHPAPVDIGSTAFILVVQLLGVLLLAYVIGNIAFAIDDANETFQAWRLELDYVQRFMQTAELPRDLQDRVRRYYSYTWNLNRGFDDFDMLKDLPSTLRTDVCLQLTQSTVLANPLFKDLDPNFMHALVKTLMKRTLVPNEFLVREGEPGDEMYFIRSGVIVILVSGIAKQRSSGALRPNATDNEEDGNGGTMHGLGKRSSARKYAIKAPSPQVSTSSLLPGGSGSSSSSHAPIARQVQTCVEGDLLGEFAVFLEDNIRTSSAMAITYCDLFVLTREDMAEILSYYPQVQTELETRVMRRRQLALKKEENILVAAGAAPIMSGPVTGPGARSTRFTMAAAAASAHAHGQSHMSLAQVAQVAHQAQRVDKMRALLGGGSTAGNNDDPSTAGIKTADGGVIKPGTRRYKIAIWLRAHWLTTSPKYAWWQRFILAISFYNALGVPLRLAFYFDAAQPALLLIDYLTDCFLLFNIFANFWLRYPPKHGSAAAFTAGGHDPTLAAQAQGSSGQYEDFATARRRYTRGGWFWWDLLTCFPLDFIMIYTGMNPWLRIGRCMRFFTDARALSVQQLQAAGLSNSAIGLIQLCTVFLLLTHWASCVYWGFGYWVGYTNDPQMFLPKYSFREAGVTASYLYSQYETWTLFTGIGEKATPQSDGETIYVVLMIVFGILFVAWIIGEVGELISNLDRFNAEFCRQMFNTNQFMHHRHFDARVQTRVRQYLSHWWSTRRGADPHVAMDGLPAGLRSEIMHHMCQHLLMRVPLFRKMMDAEPNFGRKLVERLSFVSFPGDEYIFHRGEIGDAMYFITEGEVGIIVGHTTSGLTSDEEIFPPPSKIIGDGSFFGEVACLSGGLRTASIRALTPTFLLVLSKEHLWELMEAHPLFDANIRQVCAERASKLAFLADRHLAPPSRNHDGDDDAPDGGDIGDDDQHPHGGDGGDMEMDTETESEPGAALDKSRLNTLSRKPSQRVVRHASIKEEEDSSAVDARAAALLLSTDSADAAAEKQRREQAAKDKEKEGEGEGVSSDGAPAPSSRMPKPQMSDAILPLQEAHIPCDHGVQMAGLLPAHSRQKSVPVQKGSNANGEPSAIQLNMQIQGRRTSPSAFTTTCDVSEQANTDGATTATAAAANSACDAALSSSTSSSSSSSSVDCLKVATSNAHANGNGAAAGGRSVSSLSEIDHILANNPLDVLRTLERQNSQIGGAALMKSRQANTQSASASNTSSSTTTTTSAATATAGTDGLFRAGHSPPIRSPVTPDAATRTDATSSSEQPPLFGVPHTPTSSSHATATVADNSSKTHVRTNSTSARPPLSPAGGPTPAPPASMRTIGGNITARARQQQQQQRSQRGSGTLAARLVGRDRHGGSNEYHSPRLGDGGPESACHLRLEFDRTNATQHAQARVDAGASEGDGSTGSGATTGRSRGVFTQARRLAAERIIDTAVRIGVVQSEEQLASVVNAVEQQLEQEESEAVRTGRRPGAVIRRGSTSASSRRASHSVSVSVSPSASSNAPSRLTTQAQAHADRLDPPTTGHGHRSAVTGANSNQPRTQQSTWMDGHNNATSSTIANPIISNRTNINNNNNNHRHPVQPNSAPPDYATAIASSSSPLAMRSPTGSPSVMSRAITSPSAPASVSSSSSSASRPMHAANRQPIRRPRA